MPTTKSVIDRLRAVASELQVERGALAGADARRLAEELNSCIDVLATGQDPRVPGEAETEDEPPPTGTGTG